MLRFCYALLLKCKHHNCGRSVLESSIYKRVGKSSQFRQLVSRRTKLSWTLSAIMLGSYYSFILIIAFFPQIFSISIGNSAITVGIPVGIGIIFLAFILTGIYVNVANKEFDDLSAQIKSQVESEE